jgi:hypothetical protein
VSQDNQILNHEAPKASRPAILTAAGNPAALRLRFPVQDGIVALPKAASGRLLGAYIARRQQ